ncbi:dipeptide/oligopeptide/nickel ABC transporter permease/ATP-binding protein [Microbacterium saperdae]|uniref:Peptide/nickel transport system permease protein n=1 Tax=Microbacterium saperdae TaxID=69368 RepID=A0A543BL77_9MICO|nr:dipeptide/oligopeptide/nickel ABC transporter permease/ATP-binding protein [Microbacterium saperdae]TQL85558.1 peptide/nickel transport system permease protein [Microbacterium saperdae]GGM62825.1 dipeptide/oligopeptide/nickel ABC transporter ATP-binding protein [Microbacterium saperdae]
MTVAPGTVTVAVATTDLAPVGVLRRLARNPVALVSTLFLLLVLVLGILAPWIAPFPPNQTNLDFTNAPPFQGPYILGGDMAGRDILSRLLIATVGTLQAGVVLLLVSLALGVTTGLVAGYFGGTVDAVLSWVANITLTLPGMVLLVAMYTVLGPNIIVFMAIFGLLIFPGYFWLVRTLVVNVRSELYIDAARVAGLSDSRIISRHVLRAVRGPIIIQSSFVLAAGIAAQASLEFIGLGNSTVPSWGGVLNEAFLGIYVAPLSLVWPALLITLVTLALVLLGNTLRDTLQTSGSRHVALTRKAVAKIQADAGYAPGATTSAARAAADTIEPLLRIEGLRLGYPDSAHSVVPVVKGVDLAVAPGEIHGLVGESGSGKSQVAFSVLGILPKEAVILGGRIGFEGQELLGSPAAFKNVRGRKIAYIPQEPMSNLDPTFTVGQQLIYGLQAVKRIGRGAARRELVELLQRVGIKNADAVFDLYPHQVSGGMAQRILIAGALAGDPDLIIADEPTTALDVTVQAEVLDLLRDLRAERNLGMVLVTHNFGVVADICDRISVMREGVIVESDTAEALFENPTHEYTQMLLGSSMTNRPARQPLNTTAGHHEHN